MRKIIGLLIVVLLAVGYADGLAMHIKSDGSLGSNTEFGWRVGNVEVLAGYNFMNETVAFAGETAAIYGSLPVVGGRFYVLNDDSKGLGLFIGGDYAQGQVLLKSSNEALDQQIQDSLNEKINFKAYAIYVGSEYFLNKEKSFALSTEIGIKTQEIKLRSYDEDANVVDVISLKQASYGAVGLGYYF